MRCFDMPRHEDINGTRQECLMVHESDGIGRQLQILTSFRIPRGCDVDFDRDFHEKNSDFEERNFVLERSFRLTKKKNLFFPPTATHELLMTKFMFQG